MITLCTKASQSFNLQLIIFLFTKHNYCVLLVKGIIDYSKYNKTTKPVKTYKSIVVHYVNRKARSQLRSRI